MTQRAWTAKQLKRIPELRFFRVDDPIARRSTDRFQVGWWVAGAVSLLGMAVWTLVCVGVVVACVNLVRSESATVAILAGVFLAWPIGLWLALSFGDFLVYRRTLRKLRSELRRRGIPICVKCGYEGGDISAPRCPECGAPAGA